MAAHMAKRGTGNERLEQMSDPLVKPRKRQLSPSVEDKIVKKRQVKKKVVSQKTSLGKQLTVSRQDFDLMRQDFDLMREDYENKKNTIFLLNEEVKHLHRIINDYQNFKFETWSIMKQNNETILRLETQIKDLRNNTVQRLVPPMQPRLDKQEQNSTVARQVFSSPVLKPVNVLIPIIENKEPVVKKLVNIEPKTAPPFKTIKINEDGDCQYASIAYLLKMDTISVKKDIANYYRQTKLGEIEKIQSKLYELNDRENEKWFKDWRKEEKRYKMEMKRNGDKPTKQHLHRLFQRYMCDGIENSRDYWGDEDTLEVAGKLYHVRFQVYDNKSTLFYTTVNKSTVTGMLQLFKDHYMPIVSSVSNYRLMYPKN